MKCSANIIKITNSKSETYSKVVIYGSNDQYLGDFILEVEELPEFLKNPTLEFTRVWHEDKDK